MFTLFKTRSYNLTLISSLFADGIHHKYIHNINAVFTLLIILSICAMLYVYWTKFGALGQTMDRIQRQNKLIQSQIEFEKIKKDIEQKKLKKRSYED